MKEVKDLLSALAGPTDEPVACRVVRGKVVEDNLNGTVDVYVGGGSVAVEAAYLDHYTPAVNDEVVILASGVDRIVIGKFA